MPIPEHAILEKSHLRIAHASHNLGGTADPPRLISLPPYPLSQLRTNLEPTPPVSSPHAFFLRPLLTTKMVKFTAAFALASAFCLANAEEYKVCTTTTAVLCVSCCSCTCTSRQSCLMYKCCIPRVSCFVFAVL